MKQVSLLVIIIFTSLSLKSQNINLSAGSDIPYQHYIGASAGTRNIDFTIRTGILVPPYSDMVLSLLEQLGTRKSYTRMLESAYQFGWMNSISAQYKFGLEKSWYCGLDLRLDYLTAADTPFDLIEAAVGAQFNIFDFFNPLEVNAKLGLTTYASGIRIGRKFALGSSKKNSLNLEFSIAKHFMTQSRFLINGNKAEDTNKIIDNMLWENVFKNYGYLGGIGISYHFSL